MMWKAAVVAGLMVVLISGAVWAQTPNIVSTAWLADHLHDENTQIVDLRDNLTDYWAGHVPGAQYLSIDALRWPRNGVPEVLLDVEALAQLMGRMGVTADGTVIIYAEESNFKPAYLAWALDYLGHKQWAIVDGGFKKWTAEQRPVTSDYPKTTACHCFSYIGPDKSVRSSIDGVQGRGADAVLLDVRAAKAYTGEEGPWKRKGHIPGALSHPWTEDVAADGTWKSKDQLVAAYQALGATPEKMIITSCGQGLMSAHTYVTLRYILNYPNVANYDGGFSEWQSMATFPVTAGDKP